MVIYVFLNPQKRSSSSSNMKFIHLFKFCLPGSRPDQDFQSGSGFADPIECGSEAVVETLVVGSTRLQFLFVKEISSTPAIHKEQIPIGNTE